MKIGAQLFTVHDFTKTLEDFEESLKKISEIGFKYVQVSGTCDYDAAWLKEKLDKYGLKCILTHINQKKLLEEADQIITDHNVFDCKYIGLGGMPGLWLYDDISNDRVTDDFIRDYTEVMKKVKASGKYFMYHNHHYEFAKRSNGKTIWDTLIEEIPADLMGFTVDTYWIQFGGASPEKEIRKLKGRAPCVHFKDYEVLRKQFPSRGDSVRFTTVGDGNLDWDGIIDACQYAGTEYILIEQDDCFGKDPFECLKKSFEFLKSKGLEVE